MLLNVIVRHMNTLQDKVFVEILVLMKMVQYTTIRLLVKILVVLQIVHRIRLQSQTVKQVL